MIPGRAVIEREIARMRVHINVGWALFAFAIVVASAIGGLAAHYWIRVGGVGRVFGALYILLAFWVAREAALMLPTQDKNYRLLRTLQALLKETQNPLDS